MVSKRVFEVLFYVALIAIEFLATVTTIHIEVVESMWDKSNHFIAFFTLFILLSCAYRLKESHKIILLFIFGVQIELVQHFLPPREASFLDIVADSVGILIGYILFKILKRFFINYCKEL